MMILEPEFMDNFNDPYTDDDPNTLHFGNVSILMLAIFMLFTPIMLMNLLVSIFAVVFQQLGVEFNFILLDDETFLINPQN